MSLDARSSHEDNAEVRRRLGDGANGPEKASELYGVARRKQQRLQMIDHEQQGLSGGLGELACERDRFF
jgi:hypothetical protein